MNKKKKRGKSLTGMPSFTVTEIEDQRKESEKNGATFEETSERDLQFKNKLYMNPNTIQIMYLFKFKGSATLVQRRKNAL